MGIPPQHMPLVQIPLKEADTLQSIFDENPGTDYELVFLYICNWGKHRSFAVAWVHEFIFRKLRARSVARAESLSARHFGKWSCGANACEECDFRLDEKEAVHEFFLWNSSRHACSNWEVRLCPARFCMCGDSEFPCKMRGVLGFVQHMCKLRAVSRRRSCASSFRSGRK